MNISCIDPETDPRWRRFIEEHPSASVFHTQPWLAALRRTYGYPSVAYVAGAPGMGLSDGVPFCRVNSRLTGRRLVSLPFSDHCQSLADRPEVLIELLAAMKDDATKNRCRYVETRPLVPYEPVVSESAQFTSSHEAVIHRLDLRPGRDGVFHGLHKQCIQRKLSRSSREGLRYEKGQSSDLLDKFYHLLLLTRRRHRLPPQPVAWFRNLVDCFGDSAQIRVASLQDGTPVASIVTLSYRNVVTYKYGCSDPFHNASGGMILLLWRAIEDAIENGVMEFDLGRSDHDTPGLITFKDRWGAARSELRYYTHPGRAEMPLGGAFANVARRLVAAAPDPVFTAVGGFLYRHVA